MEHLAPDRGIMNGRPKVNAKIESLSLGAKNRNDLELARNMN